ncbi:glycosyltransferase [Aliidiomarina indica]|uniref:glycosyltransferase n=1 Tax=Aliidiomarina indica TaxID=2749147 RepID=UPI0018903225|nr:glycosyltransferase [Aliidiomarina indica]
MKQRQTQSVMVILPNFNAGGAERVAINYINHLFHQNMKVYVVIFEDNGAFKSLLPDEINVICLGTVRTSQSFGSLALIIYKLKPDVVFTTHSRTALLVGIVRLFTFRFVHIARMQSMPSLERASKSYGRIRRYMYAFGFKQADRVIAQTEAMRLDAIRVFGLQAYRVRVLPNLVDVRSIELSLLGQMSPFDHSKINAVAAGRLCRAKGFDVLIKAIPKVINSLPNFRLHILGGDGGDIKILTNLIDSLGMQGYVKILGHITNPYIYFANCSLFILSSRREGFPNVLLENYTLNTPIVATQCVPVVDELIKNGVNGYTVPTDDVNKMVLAILKCSEIKRDGIKNSAYMPGDIVSLIHETISIE